MPPQAEGYAFFRAIEPLVAQASASSAATINRIMTPGTWTGAPLARLRQSFLFIGSCCTYRMCDQVPDVLARGEVSFRGVCGEQPITVFGPAHHAPLPPRLTPRPCLPRLRAGNPVAAGANKEVTAALEKAYAGLGITKAQVGKYGKDGYGLKAAKC